MEIEEVLEKIDEQYEREAFAEFRKWLAKRSLYYMNKEINRKVCKENIVV